MNRISRKGRPAEMLVVDDDPRNCRILAEYLAGDGYRVHAAHGGREALALAHDLDPDVIFLDVMMPDMTGLDVCRELKTHARTRLIQIMMVTALEGTSHRVEGLDCGADDYVTKPVRREEFMAKSRSLLRVRRLLVELEEARATLAVRNSELEELEALKETLAQTLIHDLKTPLTAVVGNLDLIASIGDTQTTLYAQRAKAATARMQRMILDLLDVAGLEERRLALDLQEVDAGELARNAASEADVSARQRSVRVVAEVHGDGCIVRGDPSVLRRVLDNLLTNATEHAPAGSTVTVFVNAQDEGVAIDVADQGAGVPEEHRERIFEKYARLQLRNAGMVANRGLGLTFCRLAVEAHGGAIWVENAELGGAVFKTLLPSTEPQPAIEGQTASAVPVMVGG